MESKHQSVIVLSEPWYFSTRGAQRRLSATMLEITLVLGTIVRLIDELVALIWEIKVRQGSEQSEKNVN